MRRVALRRPRLRRASPARRLHASLLCVGFALSLIAGRLVQLQGLEGAAFSKQAAKYKLQVIQIPAERGSITTADGTILAMTVQEDKVIADPPQIAGTTPQDTMAARQQMAALLAGPLHMTKAAILGKLYHPSSRDYVVLAPGVPALAGNRIQRRGLQAVLSSPLSDGALDDLHLHHCELPSAVLRRLWREPDPAAPFDRRPIGRAVHHRRCRGSIEHRASVNRFHLSKSDLQVRS